MFGFVSRAKFERLEDKLDAAELRYRDLEQHYRELQAHCDKLVESLTAPAAEPESAPPPPPQGPPRRPLGREVVHAATRAREEAHRLAKGLP
jgi:hypothetical protein